MMKIKRASIGLMIAGGLLFQTASAEKVDVEFTVTAFNIFGTHTAEIEPGDPYTSAIGIGNLTGEIQQNPSVIGSDIAAVNTPDPIIIGVGVTQLNREGVDCTAYEGSTNATFENPTGSNSTESKTRIKMVASVGCFVGCFGF